MRLFKLPTLYFSILMAAHMLDHFVFTSRRLTEKHKWIVFGVVTFTIVATFWWFRGLAFGMDGPIADHWGLQWRKVRLVAHPGAIYLTRSPLDLEHIQLVIYSCFRDVLAYYAVCGTFFLHRTLECHDHICIYQPAS